MKLKKLIAGTALIIALPSAFAEWQALGVNLEQQKYSEWCWAATTKLISNYYGKPAEQCDIVNWAYGLNYACYGPNEFKWNNWANRPNDLYGSNGSMQNILWNKGIGTTVTDRALGWGDLVWDIKNYRPFILRYGWTSGGGHVLVARGYEDYNGVKSVFVANSWPGEGYGQFRYDWMVAANDHRWTHTMRMNDFAH